MNKYSVMKNVMFLALSMLVVFSAEAQKEKKPNINKAKTFMDQGKLDEAQAMIDRATEYEKTMNDGKTWYYRGLIYATIDTTSNEDYKSLSDNAREIAIESFAKADELADEGKSYYVYAPNGLPITMDQQVSQYFNYYFNKGIEAFNTEDLEGASRQFEYAWTIQKSDTASVVNAAYAAQAAGNNDRAYDFFQKTLEAGSTNKNVYYSLISISNQREDWEASLAHIQRAKEVYPTDNTLNRYEVTTLIKLDKVEEAMEQLKVSIENEPTDPMLRFSLALLYEETGDKEKAVETYEGALEVDPDHYESNFNLAVIQFNKANTLYKEYTGLTNSSADIKKGRSMQPAIKKGFTEALPIWEKVYGIKSDDQSTLQTLMFLYDYLNMSDKADKIEKELNALEN